jgi:hypothetical protein
VIKASPVATIVHLRDVVARTVLRELATGGARVVRRVRCPHGSDCDCRPEHLSHTMRHCRCVQIARVRTFTGPWDTHASDWLLLWGDIAEGPVFRLQGPYVPDTPLSYGGGFWDRVEV